MLRSACIATVISVNAARILRTPTFLYRCATAAANIAAVFQLSQSLAIAANPPPGPADTYFGVGCFWHVQHEFVEAEKFILHRDVRDITSVAGYAGGAATKDAVCYHNARGANDYGKLRYAEVVKVDVPEASKFPALADTYFRLFRNRDRPDTGDRGAEYRSVVGIPGGVSGELYPALAEAAARVGIALRAGVGSDADTLGTGFVWVLDSAAFPFRAAELYHQFHDGFMPGEQYPESYNALRAAALQRGLIQPTGCPEA